jgi:hypothetical protein
LNARRALRRVILPLTALVLLAACSSSSGGQQDVFQLAGGFTSGFPAHTYEVEDVGLSWGWLRNTSSQVVRLTSVRFADPPPSLQLLNVTAYSYKETHDTGIISQAGVLPEVCPHEYRPHPIGVVTVPAHRNAAWLVVLAFTIGRPGVYHLNQVRIDYETAGHRGWQYQNINTTATVSNPPLPGPMPLPPSAVCYNPKTAP